MLSASRIVIAAPLIWALETDHMVIALVLVALAILSDFMDGLVARLTHDITNLGKLLDPIADKFLMLAVMIFLIFDPERRFPIFFFLLLGIRDLTISNFAAYLMNRQSDVFQAGQVGKWFISVLALAILLYILKFSSIGFWVLIIATVLLLISWFVYIRYYVSLIKELSVE